MRAEGQCAGSPLLLLVEDDDDLREVTAAILKRAGYRVATARDGQAALEMVRREMPAIIFLDMRMPVMDGWAFAREFRARHDRRARIVVVTAAASAQRRAEEIAADGFLAKPFLGTDFIRLAKTHLDAE